MRSVRDCHQWFLIGSVFWLLSTLVHITSAAEFELRQGDHICYVGNTLADRMQHHGWLETMIQSRFSNRELVFRNLGFSADELQTRPRSSNFGDPDSHLTHSRADVVFAFFGYNESFQDDAGLDAFRDDLREFLDHTSSHRYNAHSAPRIVLFSPIAHENLGNPNLPDGIDNNRRLEMYTAAMAEVAEERNIPFVDLYHPTLELYATATRPLTVNGIHLNDTGNRAIAGIIVESLFGSAEAESKGDWDALRSAVLDKNLYWFNRYRATDGYSVYGDRSTLRFVDGQTNSDVMQREMEILDAMTTLRDVRIWAVARGNEYRIDTAAVPEPLEVKTNKPGRLPGGKHAFLGGSEAVEQLSVGQGFEINLFASEEMFPELANPVQSAVDTDSRLWVAVWPTYPHWNPTKPLNDKLLILPDDNGDGIADQCIVFADGLHNPTGFEFWGGGVLVAQAPDIMFLKDTDGDDRADVRLRILNGLDSADTHHTANSFVIGPDGWLYFQRGIFHVTNVESPHHAPFRGTESGIYRFNPRTYRFEYHFNMGPNPHGNVFDKWGFQFASDGTSGNGYYVGFPGRGTPKTLYRKRVRPVSAMGLLSSAHFPESMRGNLLVCNVIGFLGVAQHRFVDEGAGFHAQEIEPVVMSADPNFRPSDVEIGGDGALYILDWHNPLIGHMQHNLRDPSRDNLHGRVYRVTAKGHATLEPPKMKGKPIDEVMQYLMSDSDAVRYRARLELSGRDSQDVVAAVNQWSARFDPSQSTDALPLVEALWIHQQHRIVNQSLLDSVLRSPEPHARVAATRVLHSWMGDVSHAGRWLVTLAKDSDPRVRAEALVAAVDFEGPEAAEALFEVQQRPTDTQLDFVIGEAMNSIDVDTYLSQSVAQQRPLSEPAKKYMLKNASVADLLKLEQSSRVYEAILARNEATQAELSLAIEGIAKTRGETKLSVLVNLIEELDAQHAEASFVGLGNLLMGQPVSELKTIQDRLAQLALDGSEDATRKFGFAAWIAAVNDPETVYQKATSSTERVRDFLESIPRIPDPDVRRSTYEIVRKLLFENPHPAGEDSELIRDIAVRVLSSIPGNAPQKFEDFQTLLLNGESMDAVIQALVLIPESDWSSGKLPELARVVCDYVAELPLRERTSSRGLDALRLGGQIASKLPKEIQGRFRARLSDLKVDVIQIGTIPHRMVYDQERIAVEAGKLVEFVFTNSDQMPHNFAVTLPGSLEQVGLMAEATAESPDAAQRHYIPKTDKILVASRLLQPGETESIGFQVPKEVGIYPYVCTYPGHWRRMYGGLYVVDDLQTYLKDPKAYLAANPLPLKDELLRYNERNTHWTIESLASSIAPLAGERSYEIGRSVFALANCVGCHRFNGTGQEFGPDLAKLDEAKTTPESLLNAILDPDRQIEEKYQTYTFLLDSGRVLTGMILEETGDTVKLIVDPLAKTDAVEIKVAEIELRKKSENSLMPAGLVNRLSREEVLDLIAYVLAGGDKEDKIYHAAHHH